ncbi:MAG: hypothetical protein R3E53_00630 [Myxococcota bacterium]
MKRSRIEPSSTVRATCLWLSLACLAGAGCNLDGEWFTEQSREVATDDIRAVFSATASGDGRTVVEARLITDLGSLFFDDVILVDHDRLFVKRIDPIDASEREKLLDRKRGPRYRESFGGEAKDTGFEIRFDRPETGHRNAPDSRASLPTPFTLRWVDDPIANTPAPEPFSRSSATPYYVVWDPFDSPDFEPGDVLTYMVSGPCIQSRDGTLDWEAGEDVLQLTGFLMDLPPPDDGRSCPIRVRIVLERAGSIDPEFSRGSFFGRQVRELRIQSEP